MIIHISKQSIEKVTTCIEWNATKNLKTLIFTHLYLKVVNLNECLNCILVLPKRSIKVAACTNIMSNHVLAATFHTGCKTWNTFSINYRCIKGVATYMLCLDHRFFISTYEHFWFSLHLDKKKPYRNFATCLMIIHKYFH